MSFLCIFPSQLSLWNSQSLVILAFLVLSWSVFFIILFLYSCLFFLHLPVQPSSSLESFAITVHTSFSCPILHWVLLLFSLQLSFLYIFLYSHHPPLNPSWSLFILAFLILFCNFFLLFSPQLSFFLHLSVQLSYSLESFSITGHTFFCYPMFYLFVSSLFSASCYVVPFLLHIFPYISAWNFLDHCLLAFLVLSCIFLSPVYFQLSFGLSTCTSSSTSLFFAWNFLNHCLYCLSCPILHIFVTSCHIILWFSLIVLSDFR